MTARGKSSASRRSSTAEFRREALSARLEAGAVALGLRLDAAVLARLIGYLALLAKWNGVYNLTAVRDPDDMLVQHLLDSLSIVGPLGERGPFGRLVDVGSGGGLPGIVLATVWPQTIVHLVEPVGKKAAFLRQCAVELALANVQVHGCRVEELRPAQIGTPDLIVCRAFASLVQFAEGIARLVAPTTIVAAMKGAIPRDEIEALPDHWQLAETLPLSVPELDAQRHLLLLRPPGAQP